MSSIDGWMFGLLAVSVSLSAVCLFAVIAIVENLKDVKAYQFTIIDQLGTIDERLRDGNLQVLKCLKGESYSGSLGGMDVHTSTAMPPGGGFMFSMKRDPDA